MRDELERVRDWAQDKLQGGSEPPWAWYQYMKLVEAVTTILEGMDATKEHSPQSEPRPGTPLRLVGETAQPDSAPLQPSDPKPRLPL